MKLAELIPGLPLADGLADLEISGLTEDSRQVQPGMLFAAFRGVRTDGMRYAAQAVANGAAVVLTGEDADAADIGAPVVKVSQPRSVLARAAARFYGCQPETVIGVTGTNGKTSVASFTRQIWAACGHDAASLGTVGVVTSRGEQPLKHTTPDAITLHQLLAGLARSGVTHLALEASSHGLEQARLDGVRFTATAFTNITRDHLDYHPTFEDYFAAKLRLFRELAGPGTAAVIDADAPGADPVAREAASRGLEVMTVGRRGEAIRLERVERIGFRQRLSLSVMGRKAKAELPLAGDFQASNALVAAGLALATGCEEAAVFAALENLRGAKGRLEFAGETQTGAQIFIDYAHTPDALAKALQALRPYTANRLHVVFGCGGDRDPGKRPQMGAAASANADVVFVTDDNPRSEDPAAIRAAILGAARGAVEIGDRAQAIAEAITGLLGGDVLLVAGKGHETGQIIGGAVVPFSDHDEVAKALAQASRANQTAMAHHG